MMTGLWICQEKNFISIFKTVLISDIKCHKKCRNVKLNIIKGKLGKKITQKRFQVIKWTKITPINNIKGFFYFQVFQEKFCFYQEVFLNFTIFSRQRNWQFKKCTANRIDFRSLGSYIQGICFCIKMGRSTIFPEHPVA